MIVWEQSFNKQNMVNFTRKDTKKNAEIHMTSQIYQFNDLEKCKHKKLGGDYQHITVLEVPAECY